MNDKQLVQMALDAQKNSYSPYSKYKVGAALLCHDQTVYTGTNIENASYPCGICAERVAMSKAISEGNKNFVKIAIAGSSAQYCTPCGLCRQFMYEFNSDLTILCANNKGDFITQKLNELLKDGFAPNSL